MKKVYQVQEYGRRYRLEVEAFLHRIGTQRPYFSVTAELWRANANGERDARFHDCGSCGCLHDDILRADPALADLVAMHLSDESGEPMHAEANGWYWLAGYLSSPSESYAQYHGANGTTTKTPSECLRIFADRCRITKAEALKIAKLCAGRSAEDARACWARQCEAMRPRWKAEADAVIAKYGLTEVA